MMRQKEQNRGILKLPSGSILFKWTSLKSLLFTALKLIQRELYLNINFSYS